MPALTTDTIADCFAAVNSSARGVTTREAQRRLATDGPNEPVTKVHHGRVRQLLLLFADPLVIILLSASVVSAAVGELANAAIIAAIVLLSTAIDFVQSTRSEQAMQRLRGIVSTTASVLRDGAWCELPRREIVRGDVVRLSAGDLVPADARLIESRDLHAHEAALTGESFPVEKEPVAALATTKDGAARGMVWQGTSIVSGTGTAVVLATGRATRFGDIAARLAERHPETEFERGTRRFGLLIVRVVLFLVLIVFLSSVLVRRDPLQSLLFAVALAVGLTPEFLPMIITVTLSYGAVRMARRNVIVKHLAALQNFGSIDILCCDKTGTLTSGTTTLEQSTDVRGNPSERVFELALINSHFQTGIKSPMDAAILDHPRAAAAVSFDAYQKFDELPFDFERRRLSVALEHAGRALLITKGAPEGVLPRCSRCEIDGAAQPLAVEERQQIAARFAQWCEEGYRVLAVAYRDLPSTKTVSNADETDLVLAGFLTFVDPLLPDIDKVLAGLRDDGVQVKILTGDNELVTRHACARAGLDGTSVVLGNEIDPMTDPALAHVAEQSQIFARLTPAQKNRVILALKSRSHVVGFLGDGINDAPSLRAADVGIAVSTATDVAKDAADIVLLEPRLQTLHDGILEGRMAFGNVMKYLLMGTSSNFGNMISMAIASLFLPFLPMLPVQILLNNFLYDLAQTTIPTDRVDATFTRKPRRWDIALVRKFMLVIGPISSVYDLLTFAVLLWLFHASQPLFHTGWFVESLATQTLVLFVIRTADSFWRSRPSTPLVATILTVVVVGVALPFLPVAHLLGFVPLPASFFLVLVAIVTTYLALVEFVKRRLFGGHAFESALQGASGLPT
ncbi:MAG TPA: magnesium-translocating P-type ATPase [Pirellulales bacterium]|nr:magnesium-translocating P-type ATPase [Pirellulales bacterium]